MRHGLDTGFLVVAEHAEHSDAQAALARLLGVGDQIAIAPQVLAEFIHIVTDSRRFTHPLDMAAARQLAEQWWTARDVVQVFPDDGAEAISRLGEAILSGTQAAVRYAARRDLPTNRHPIAADDKPDRLRRVRRVRVHHAE